MKKYRAYYILLVILILIYLAELILIPPDSAALTRYSISGSTAKLIAVSFVIPLFIIWYTAFYGFIRFKQYALLAADSKDGEALNIIANGLMVLALSLPITSIIGSPRTYVGNQNPELVPTITILYNYLVLGVSLIALWLVSFGAKRLVRTLKEKPRSAYQVVLAVIFIVFSILYVYLTMHDINKIPAVKPVGAAAYYLPDFLVFSTLVIPYILLWYLGFRGAYHIRLYSANVPGVLYKKALKQLSAGIAAVVVSLMILRLLTSLSSFLNSLSLRYLLVFIYALLIMIGIGYALIAFGAKKLKKIEEV